jgi:hypothetical protein
VLLELIWMEATLAKGRIEYLKPLHNVKIQYSRLEVEDNLCLGRAK